MTAQARGPRTVNSLWPVQIDRDDLARSPGGNKKGCSASGAIRHRRVRQQDLGSGMTMCWTLLSPFLSQFCPSSRRRGQHTSVLAKQECSTNVGTKTVSWLALLRALHEHLVPLCTGVKCPEMWPIFALKGKVNHLPPILRQAHIDHQMVGHAKMSMFMTECETFPRI